LRNRGNLFGLMRAAKTARAGNIADTTYSRRKELAEFCRYLGARLKGERFTAPPPAIPETLKLSPRMRQTLERLLAGDSEKQIAGKLGVSPHTVHVYVKELYRGFEVSSRGELLARFVQVPGSVKGASQIKSGGKPSKKPQESGATASPNLIKQRERGPTRSALNAVK